MTWKKIHVLTVMGRINSVCAVSAIGQPYSASTESVHIIYNYLNKAFCGVFNIFTKSTKTSQLGNSVKIWKKFGGQGGPQRLKLNFDMENNRELK